jgi:hypothetical protein
MNIHCPNCDASLDVGTEHIITKCPYCGVYLYYSKDGFLSRESIKPIHDSSVAKNLIKNLIGKNLVVNMEYFPFYRIESEGKTYFVPGRKVDLYGINSYIPQGDRISLNFDVKEPELSVDEALNEAGVEVANSIGLVYLPFFIAHSGDTIYYIDASTGDILSNKLVEKKKFYSNKHPMVILNWLAVFIIALIPFDLMFKIIIAVLITAGFWYFESMKERV